jgi:hypothetical protein
VSIQLFLEICFTDCLFLLRFYIQLQDIPKQYILNQGFGNASGTTPPPGWVVEVIEGGDDLDTWNFDNPGGRSVSFPITGRFAIFDGGIVSSGDAPQQVALQSIPFDATGSNFFILMFDHTFSPGQDERAVLEVNYGDGWREIAIWDEETSNPKSEVIDISPSTV